MKGYRTQHHVHLETSTRVIDFHIGDRVWWNDHQGVRLKGTIMQFNALGRGEEGCRLPEILAIIKPDIAGTYGMARPVSILNRIVDGLEGMS